MVAPTVTSARAGVLRLLPLVLVLGIPLLDTSAKTLSLFTSAAILGIAATGLGVAWGQAGQLYVCQGAVMGVAAYVSANLARNDVLGFGPAAGVAVGVGALFGLVVSLLRLRVDGHYFVIATFAVGQLMVVLGDRLVSVTGGNVGITVASGDQTLFGWSLASRGTFGLVVAGVLLTGLGLALLIGWSRWGRVLRGVRENPALALALGVNVRLHRLAVYCIAGAYGGIAGHLFLHQVKHVDPTLFGIDLSITLVLVVLLGGRAYVVGPLVGATIHTFLPEVIELSPVQRQVAFGLTLVLLILMLPDGVLSLQTRIRRVIAVRREARRPAAVAVSPS